METLAIIITLVLSGFFSASETAYVSSNRLRFQLQKQSKSGFNPNLYMLSNAQRFLTTTLVGNNVVMVACSTLAVVLFAPYISETLLIVFTTLLLLIMGEIIPKSVAQQMPNRYIRLAAPLMFMFYIIFYPLNKIAEWMSQLALSLFKGKQHSVNTFFRKQDLLILVREYFSSQTLSLSDRQLITRAMKIGEIRVSDIMIPRTDISGIEVHTSVNQIYDMFIKTGYSRFPVYNNNLDNILGFLYYNDLLGKVSNIHRIIRPALFIPETAKGIQAMKALKTKGRSIAIVIDEHGGTAGLITMEDIVEQMFGSIYDEFDTRLSRIKLPDDSTIIASGRTEVEDLIERHNLPIPRGDYVTLSGYIQNILGYIPKPGEKIKLPFATILILQANSTKIVEVKIIKILPKPKPAQKK